MSPCIYICSCKNQIKVRNILLLLSKQKQFHVLRPALSEPFVPLSHTQGAQAAAWGRQLQKASFWRTIILSSFPISQSHEQRTLG